MSTPTTPPANQPQPGDQLIPTRLRAYANTAEQTGTINGATDPNLVPTLTRAADLVEKKAFGVPWRRTYSGSGDNKGWSVMAGSETVAYLGGDESFGQAVDQLVLAHNKALGYVE